MYTALVLLVIVAVCTASNITSNPSHPYGMLMAPWTPFNSDGTINEAAIIADAKFAAAAGVTHVFAVGGAAQWYALQLTERKHLAELWVKYGQQNNLRVLIQVGGLCIADAVELARHAESIGADGIAVLAPSYPARPSTVDELVTILGIIHRGAPKTKFYYYHLPGSTNLYFKMSEMLEKVESVIPTFAGIKYVENDQAGLDDYVKCLQYRNGKYAAGMFAANKDLPWIAAGARSFVLMEAYYTPTILKELDAFMAGDHETAQEHFDYYRSLTQVNGGGVNRAVMKMIGIDMGDPRLPVQPVSAQKYEEAHRELTRMGFFDTIPKVPTSN